jgi:hypothetical protein
MTTPEIEVTVVPGFMVGCADVRCGVDGQVKFFTDVHEAEKYRTDHIDVHRQHAERIKAILGEYKTDDNGSVVGASPGLFCSGCSATIGEEHGPYCDVARCLPTGAQRAYRDHVIMNGGIPENHDCGKDIWTGYYPGEKEAAEYGVPVMVLKELGRWDADKLAWVMDEGWEQRMQERGLGPAISGA